MLCDISLGNSHCGLGLGSLSARELHQPPIPTLPPPGGRGISILGAVSGAHLPLAPMSCSAGSKHPHGHAQSHHAQQVSSHHPALSTEGVPASRHRLVGQACVHLCRHCLLVALTVLSSLYKFQDLLFDTLIISK